MKKSKKEIAKDRETRLLPEEDRLRLAGAERIGIMGGTFDPVHFGHLCAAESVLWELKLDFMMFIPAGIPAFKLDIPVTAGDRRFEMTRMATASNPKFYVSRAEIERKGVTYTIDTIKALRGAVPPKARLFFVAGEDAFADVLKWKGARELFKLTAFVVVRRPGSDRKKLISAVNQARREHGARIRTLEIPGLDISSSCIRERVASGKPIRYLLPEQVVFYIRENGLYSAKSAYTPEELLARVRQTQSEKRFVHTISVADEARRLARLHGVDPEKAYLAGILHDSAKGLADEKILDKAKQYKIALDDATARPGLAHGPVGAEMARIEFGVTDEDVLNAVRYHTTGRPNMSKLEKVVFVADYIEPSRAAHTDLERIRACAGYDLDAAVIMILESKIAYNAGKGPHPLSKRALDYATYHYQEECFE